MDRIIASLFRGIKAANRQRQEANAKEEVRQALEELLACRANPDRPGC
jgi:predicted component of type VI protein secretion system